MKILIVYDSLFGNTEQVAKAIEKAINKKDTKLIKVQNASSGNIRDIDMFILGSPVHGGRASQDTKKFMDRIPRKGLEGCSAATFDTGVLAEGQGKFGDFIIKFFGYAAEGMAKKLKTKGAQIKGADTFFVLGKEGPLKEGELERAKSWAKEIMKNLK